MSYYLHTLNGKPAGFYDGQICYASFYGKPTPLCSSLKQIKEEQAASRKWRREQGWVVSHSEYGHRRVAPQEEL